MHSVNDIRAEFLAFFQRHGHEVRPSGSLVPHNDPTLMFTNAGMNQFKNAFTGAETLAFVRAATAQKCVRAGGKHNDLDNVGYTARHHTFFEMLGNFSFGDYFKETAIALAWELLTKEWKIAPERLSFTVYHTDDEAFALWKKITGCDDSRILRVPTKDNFWAMGDTGPCGPCSEIFYDHGEQAGAGEWMLAEDGSDRFGDRFVEIWNLVFMQYEQLPDGTRVNLPEPSIDTGMGLERIAAVLQGKHDNYDIDLFRHLIWDIAKIRKGIIDFKEQTVREGLKRAYDIETALGNIGTGGESAAYAAYKVIADHLRSSCFLIADGVLPSNEGRGYVLRRIMRRAMRYAHQLGCKEPLMHLLVPSLITQMGKAYPELVRAEAAITDNLRQEEERFKLTLERGLKLVEEEAGKISPKGQLPGEVAFKLSDTYGFPLDLTQDILRARGIAVDTEGFERCMEQQRGMARAAWSGSGEKAVGKLWFDLKEKLGATEFVGYETDETTATVLAIIKNGESAQKAEKEEEVFIILDKTPFYGESGGQVGDTGSFLGLSKRQSPLAEIVDTIKPVEDFIVHKAKLLHPLEVGNSLIAQINSERRAAIRANHSATHLLHKALRNTLGEHVTQKGSLVAPDRLRFDFSHTKPLSREEIEAIESQINHLIWRNTPVECKIMAPKEAIEAGAMALFGEKYGEKVRVLSMGDSSFEPLRNPQDLYYSTELCGGTHVRATGDIGLFKILSEGAVAAGVRRIEAVTRAGAFAYLVDQEKTLRDLAISLKSSPSDLAIRLEQLVAERKKLEKDLSEAKKQLALGGSGVGDITAEKIGSITFIGKTFDELDPKELRNLAETYLKQAEVVALATAVEGKASVVIAVNKTLTEKISAVALIQGAVATLGGKGGGGRADMAQGGGPEAGKLAAALNVIRERIKVLGS